MTLDPNIWNKLPENIQYETSHHKFNEYFTIYVKKGDADCYDHLEMRVLTKLTILDRDIIITMQ